MIYYLDMLMLKEIVVKEYGNYLHLVNLIPTDYNFTDTEIYKYLLLLKYSEVKLHHNSNKARFMGNYIRQFTEKAILDNNPKTGNIRLDHNDLEYYIKLDPIEPTRKKKGQGLGLNDKDQQAHELTRLVAAHKAGNTNTYNEINDIVDKLRRSNIISIEDSRKIYKSLK